MTMPLPHQYVYWTRDTCDQWTRECDQYLDPYTELADRNSLRFSMDKVDSDTYLNDDIKECLEEESDLSLTRTCLFRGFTFYFSLRGDNTSEFAKKLAEIQIKFCGGSLSDTISDKVSHVVVDNMDDIPEDIKLKRRKMLENGFALFQSVTIDWIHNCVKSEKLIKFR